jgi:hypothetical protein
MVGGNGAWVRQGAAFWRAHHEAWKRSDLNQRQYCEAEGIPLKAFGNWRAIFKAEPQPPERKLLWRRRGLSPPFSPQLSPPFSPPLNPGVSVEHRSLIIFVTAGSKVLSWFPLPLHEVLSQILLSPAMSCSDPLGFQVGH